MDIATAKDYFRLGLINDVIVKAPCAERAATGAGWTIEFSGNTGIIDPILRVARKSADGRYAAKEFAKLDSAARELASIGIQSFTVLQDAKI